MPDFKNPADRRVRYDRIRTALWTDRASFDAHWRDLAEQLAPRRTRFWSSDRNRGDKRNQAIINSTGRFAARTLSSGLHAGLTSPARPWMKLTTHDSSLAKNGAVKLWLHDVTERMLTMFSTTNLYNVLPLVYLDMGVFGTASMSILQDDRDLFRCYSYPVGSYALGMDHRGLVTTFVRDYELTVRQIVEQFGVKENGRDIDWTHISGAVKALWDSSDYEAPIPITWIVRPNESADRTRLGSKYLPWASCHYERGGSAQTSDGPNPGVFLLESGFETFPIQAPRWDITGEDTYGTDCPGMTALGDTRQLQVMERRKGQAIAKMVDPPLSGPSSLKTQKTSLLPGDVTYVDVRDGMQGLKSIHEVRLDISHLTADVATVEYRVQRAFYEDLFLMLARSDDSRGQQPITAREVDERHEEKLLALGPVLERTNDELLDPIVDRVYHLMDKAGLLPPPPQQLAGVKLKVEYISILAQAQKLVGVVGQDRFLQSLGQLVEQYPEIRHKIDPFEIVDSYADMLGVDPRLVRSTEDAKADMAAASQAAAGQAQSEQALNMAKAAKAASETQVTGDTMLSRVAQSAAAGPGMPNQNGAPAPVMAGGFPAPKKAA